MRDCYMNEYAKKLQEIENKLFQLLRIKKQLESRRVSLIRSLSSSNNPQELLNYLSSLAKVCQREEKVHKICEKGLINALKILEEVEGIVNSFGSFRERVTSTLQSKIPFIGKKNNNPRSILPLMKIMHSFLKKQIIYLDENFHVIKSSIAKQHKLVLDLMIEVERGDISENITQTKHFQEIEELREEELKIIHHLERELKSKTGKMLRTINRINRKVSQNKTLLKAQAIIQIAPIVTPGTAAVGIFLGPQFIPVAYILLNIVNFSPTIAIVAKESVLSLKNPAKRAKEFAVLRAKAAAKGIRMPSIGPMGLKREPAYTYTR